MDRLTVTYSWHQIKMALLSFDVILSQTGFVDFDVVLNVGLLRLDAEVESINHNPR